MSTHQATIDGLWEVTDDHKSEVRRVCEKLPKAADDPGLLLFNIFVDRYGWPKGLSEDKQHNMREFFREVQSLDRRRQEYRAEIPR